MKAMISYPLDITILLEHYVCANWQIFGGDVSSGVCHRCFCAYYSCFCGFSGIIWTAIYCYLVFNIILPTQVNQISFQKMNDYCFVYHNGRKWRTKH